MNPINPPVSGGGGGSSIWIDTFLSQKTTNTGNNTVYDNLAIGSLGDVNHLPLNQQDASGSVITGFAGGTTKGQILIVHSIHGGNSIRLANKTSSTAGNQLDLTDGNDFTLKNDRVVTFMWDTNYWVLISVATVA